jgi:hypothetical protein
VAEKSEPATLTTQQQIDALAGRTGIKAKAKIKTLLAQRAAEQKAVARNTGFKGLELTDAEKKADAAARTAQGADQTIASDSTTGIGRAGKAAALEEFAPVSYPLHAPENLNAKGELHPAMSSLWWNDLAQMSNDAKRGSATEKALAKKAIAAGLKNKSFTRDQLDHAIETDSRNIEHLNKYGRKSIVEQNRGALMNRDAAKADVRASNKETKAAAKQIEDAKAKEAKLATEEAKAEADAERHRLTKPDELEADTGEGAIDPDAFMYRKGKGERGTHTVEEARGAVADTTKNWTNAPNVKVKADKELTETERKWLDDNQAKGFIEKSTGDIVIASDRHTDLADVKATLVHEALGHFGLRSKFRDGLKQKMQELYTHSPELRTKIDAYMEHIGEKDVSKGVEEWLSERQVTEMPQGIVSKLRAWIQNFLRDNGMKLAFNDHDVRAILRQAGEEVKSGKKSDAPLAGEQAARKKSKERFSDSIPNKLRVTIEKEGANGEVTMHEVNAKTEMRAAERRLNALNALKECMAGSAAT